MTTKSTLARRAGLGLALAILLIFVSGPAHVAKAVTPTPTPIAEARSLPANTVVTVAGTVTVQPGLFGSNFYVQDAGGVDSVNGHTFPAGGIQVYYGNKGTPAIVVGDTVTVTGAISTYGAGGYGNQRELVPASASAITITTAGAPVPLAPKVIHSGDAHHYPGQLVQISARVVGARNYGAQVLITDNKNKNQGLVVIYIYGTTGINYAPLHGESVCVTGVLEPYGYSNFPQRRFMEVEPRSPADIKESAC